MPNLLLKLLDQWIDNIALPPASRGRFSAHTDRFADTESVPVQADSWPLAVETPSLPAEPQLPVAEASAASVLPAVSQTSEGPRPTFQAAPDELSEPLHSAPEPDSTEDILIAFNWD